MIAKKRRGLPGKEADIQRDRQKDRQRDGDIRSTGPHWGPSEPSAGINASRLWNPTLEINTNKKITKGTHMTWRIDRKTYYTETQGIITRGLRPHALHKIMGHTNDIQKATGMTG